MIMVVKKVFMAQYNSYYLVFISAMLLSSGNVQAITGIPVGSAHTTNFIATITDGSCTLDYSSKELVFMPRIAADFSPGKTVEIQPIVANVSCTYAATPQVMITGTTPYASNTRIFLDNDVGNNGVGFMIQPATSAAARDTPPPLSDFYARGLTGKAIENGKTMALLPLNASNNFTERQVLWVGLVGMTDSSNIIPGVFQARLTITGIIP